MAFILPKGIVVNSPDINSAVERINAQPLDLEDIAKFWKVYTTTKRRLLDPTAERLENYWWRIWGSRKRQLNGATVARLFAHISDGQSFVPLRGPANRDEGSPPLNRTTRHGPAAASATIIHRPSQSSNTSSSTASKAPAPMPHPILKKTRGPSSNGPRPTARFISPHESDAETAMTTTDRSSSPNSHVVVQPPSPDSHSSKTDKKATGPGGAKKKGRVVASTAAKKRPVMTRRQSSQSSTDSAKVEAHNANRSSAERTPPTFSEVFHSKERAPSRFHENLSPDHLATPPRKRPSSKSADVKSTSPRKPDRKGSGESAPGTIAQGEVRPSPDLRSIDKKQISQEVSEGELELQRTLLEEAHSRVTKSSRASSQQVPNQNEDLRALQPGPTTSSDGAHDQDMSGIRLKSAASLAPTLADATGELGLGDFATPLPRVTGAQDRKKGKGRDSDDMFAKRPVPPVSGVAAAPTPEGALAKSKSQLTLLLQKDRGRSGEQKPADGKKKG